MEIIGVHHNFDEGIIEMELVGVPTIDVASFMWDLSDCVALFIVDVYLRYAVVLFATIRQITCRTCV